MDKATKTQISIIAFIVGLIMLFIPYLKNFDTVIPGISQYFSLMFYIGLLLVIAGLALIVIVLLEPGGILVFNPALSTLLPGVAALTRRNALALRLSGTMSCY